MISHTSGTSEICVYAAGEHGSAVDMESGGSNDNPRPSIPGMPLPHAPS